MCGIAGYVGEDADRTGRRIVSGMLEALSRRGPDAEGLESWPDAVFGHRRLAILDLSDAGRQPMLDAGRRTGIVFNGCIYNFQDLRRELEQDGLRFRSQCDTEVLLHGYRAWGIDTLVRKCRGMFAFAIWDEDERRLTLARDRLGVKPLIYSASPRGIAFASTVEALRASGVASGLDEQAIVSFLEYGFVTEDHAVYRNLRKLPPATILEWQDGRISQRSYWQLPGVNDASPVGFEDAVEETERLIVESVRLRLCADVPIGVLLSGGIDSALICWALAKLNANITAYTVATEGDAADESAEAAETARIIGIPHRVVSMPADGPALVDDLVHAYGEPFAAYSAQGLLHVSRAVRKSATVLLTGDGGDDVFLGYPFMYNAWLAQQTAERIPAWAPAVWERLRGHVPESGVLKRFRNFADYTTRGISAHATAHDGLPWYRRHSVLGDRLEGLRLGHRELPPSFDSARRLLTDVLAHHRDVHFTSEFMQKVDGGTMFHSLEARSPLLDHELWEFAAALPYRVRLHNGQLKAILREIVSRRVGPAVATRAKRGFTVPVERWLVTWKPALDELRGDTLLEQHGIVRRGSLRDVVDSSVARGRAPLQLWYLFVLERWLRRQSAAEAPSAFAGSYAER